MSDVMRAEKGGDHGPDDDHGQSTVKIIVNGTEYPIHRGRRTVVEIKTVGQVPLAHELAFLRSAQELVPLPDDGFVPIRGGEQFISYPKDSGSS